MTKLEKAIERGRQERSWSETRIIRLMCAVLQHSVSEAADLVAESLNFYVDQELSWGEE